MQDGGSNSQFLLAGFCFGKDRGSENEFLIGAFFAHFSPRCLLAPPPSSHLLGQTAHDFVRKLYGLVLLNAIVPVGVQKQLRQMKIWYL